MTELDGVYAFFAFGVFFVATFLTLGAAVFFGFTALGFTTCRTSAMV